MERLKRFLHFVDNAGCGTTQMKRFLQIQEFEFHVIHPLPSSYLDTTHLAAAQVVQARALKYFTIHAQLMAV